MPGISVGDPAAERRSYRRRHDDGDAIERERLSALLRRKRVRQNRLFAGRHAAAAEPLQDATHDKRIKARRQSAQQRACGEQRHADHVEALASEHVGKPAAHRQYDGIGDKIGGDDPRALVDAGAEAAGDISQRHVGDRGVEYDHEGGDGDDDGDEPRVAVAGRRSAWIPAAGRARLGHCTFTVGTTDMPGPSSTSGCSSNTILTGTRCTILT